MKGVKVYDFETAICGGDVKGYIMLYQYGKTEEEAHKEIVKTMTRLKAKFYETKTTDNGIMRMSIPALKKRSDNATI